MLDKFGLKNLAVVRVPIRGEDVDEESILLPSGRSGLPQKPTAGFSVAGGQSALHRPVYTPRHCVYGTPSDAAFARAKKKAIGV
ncbi:unnamed protein product [Peronospora belbahrii]|uniref:Uncharacterized protein n=1 Tax=Peronospora belbahrii TaxID=622444 RepID=A0AAU9KQP5_9STRA|nr:unnamed protein product [Peronospora belbahrii]